MNNVNKTLYIPLYGKALVSQKNIILKDEMAEKIWEAEGFKLRGKSKSKWLAYYMGIRSAVFDTWVKEQMNAMPGATVIHIGCGLDGRITRVGNGDHPWYDVDFAEVIEERRRYYTEGDGYKMIAGDARTSDWLDKIGGNAAIVVMEGVSMYMKGTEIRRLFSSISKKFKRARILMDAYTELAAKMSKIKNPIKDVGVHEVWGVDQPVELTIGTSLSYVREGDMTPKEYVDQLDGFEKKIFEKLYAGKMSKKLYKLYEYEKI